MWARRRLEIGWLDLAAALGFCAAPGRPTRRKSGSRETWTDQSAQKSRHPGWSRLSVRTAWDAWLQAMAFPPGSEIVISSVTIPEMARIVELNGLKCVPVTVDPNTLSPDLDELAAAIGPRTRAILVAHLFGVRLNLGAIADLARSNGLWLVEDCAQAFSGPSWIGSSEADVSLFSFGPIKTQTALGGALVRISDQSVRTRMDDVINSYPTVARLKFGWRVLKYGLFKLLTTRWAYSLVRRWCSLRGRRPRCARPSKCPEFSRRRVVAVYSAAAVRGNGATPGATSQPLSRVGLAQSIARATQLQRDLEITFRFLASKPQLTCGGYFPFSVPIPALVSTLRAEGFDASRPIA